MLNVYSENVGCRDLGFAKKLNQFYCNSQFYAVFVEDKQCICKTVALLKLIFIATMHCWNRNLKEISREIFMCLRSLHTSLMYLCVCGLL